MNEWDACVAAIAASEQVAIECGPNRTAVESAIAVVNQLKDQFPNEPPTVIIPEPNGGLIIERSLTLPSGDRVCCELTFYNDGRIERTEYRNGKIATGVVPEIWRTIQVRWMIRRDILSVIDIEFRSFDCPWTEDEFVSCLKQRNCIGMVAEIGENIVGFMVYELLKTQLHILNFAVHPSFRRQGVGSAMVAKLVRKLSQQHRNEIVLEVRESNLDAQVFFRSQRFYCTGTLRGFYEDTDEDAYRMIRLASGD